MQIIQLKFYFNFFLSNRNINDHQIFYSLHFLYFIKQIHFSKKILKM